MREIINFRISMRTNNVWTHSFDFTKNEGGWTAQEDHPGFPQAVYVDGVGWTSTYIPPQFGNNTQCSIFRQFATATITTFYLTYIGSGFSPMGSGSCTGVGLALNGGTSALNVGSKPGTNTVPWSTTGIHSANVPNAEAHVYSSPCGGGNVGQIIITQITFSGIGINPFLLHEGPADCGCGVYASIDVEGG
jgi:hypothetical protein